MVFQCHFSNLFGLQAQYLLFTGLNAIGLSLGTGQYAGMCDGAPEDVETSKRGEKRT